MGQFKGELDIARDRQIVKRQLKSMKLIKSDEEIITELRLKVLDLEEQLRKA